MIQTSSTIQRHLLPRQGANIILYASAFSAITTSSIQFLLGACTVAFSPSIRCCSACARTRRMLHVSRYGTLSAYRKKQESATNSGCWPLFLFSDNRHSLDLRVFPHIIFSIPKQSRNSPEADALI